MDYFKFHFLAGGEYPHENQFYWWIEDMNSRLFYLFKRRYIDNKMFRRIIYDYDWMDIMPKGKADANKSRNNAGKELIWRNITLTADDKAAIERQLERDDSDFLLGEGIAALLLQGISLNIKPRPDNTFIAMGFGTAIDSEGRTMGVSAFANSPDVALHALLYKYFVIMDGNWELGDTPTPDDKPAFG